MYAMNRREIGTNRLAQLELGYKTILSSNYFLSEMEHEGENWREFYSVNNAHMNAAKEYPELARGGERCLWSDLIGPDKREPFLWPDAAVVAERLWTDESQLADADTVCITFVQSTQSYNFLSSACNIGSVGYQEEVMKVLQ